MQQAQQQLVQKLQKLVQQVQEQAQRQEPVQVQELLLFFRRQPGRRQR